MIAGITLPGYLEHLSEKRIQTIIIFGVFLLQYLFEHVFPEQKKYNDLNNEGRNGLVGIINVVLLFIPSALLVELLSLISKNKIGLLQQFSFPFWLLLPLTIILMDFFMYWWHRFNHTYKFLWRFHRFHHQEKKMNSTTVFRFHTFELLLSTIFKASFYFIIGFTFLPILVYELLFFAAVIVHHSNINITESFDGVYRQLFSSPLMHRIHHSQVQEETDTNYG
ncbi:MAG: sterol desaturase family protein, partial [Chitinophagaceae bacterium]